MSAPGASQSAGRPLARRIGTGGLLAGAALLVCAFAPWELPTGSGSAVNPAFPVIALLSLLLLAPRGGVPRPRAAVDAAWLALLAVLAASTLVAWSAPAGIPFRPRAAQLAQAAVLGLSACAFWLGRALIASRRDRGTLALLVLALAVARLVATLRPAAGLGLINHLDAPPATLWFAGLPAALAADHDGLRRGWRLLLIALACAVVGAGLLVNFSWKSGWLPALAALATVVVVAACRRSRRVGLALGIGLVAAGVLVGLQAAASERWSLETRRLLWGGLLEVVAGRWPIGLGLLGHSAAWPVEHPTLSYRDAAGYHHRLTFEPAAMHSDWLDLFGQGGVLAVAAYAAVLALAARSAARAHRSAADGLGRAWALAGLAACAATAAAGLLADWHLPLVYNQGLKGFRNAAVGWLLLGAATRADPAPDPGAAQEAARPSYTGSSAGQTTRQS